jgi:hypothetical protein
MPDNTKDAQKHALATRFVFGQRALSPHPRDAILSTKIIVRSRLSCSTVGTRSTLAPMRVADPSSDFNISIRNYLPEKELEVKVWLELATRYSVLSNNE